MFNITAAARNPDSRNLKYKGAQYLAKLYIAKVVWVRRFGGYFAAARLGADPYGNRLGKAMDYWTFTYLLF